MKNHSIKIKDLLLGLVFSLALAATACSLDEVTQVREAEDDGTISFKPVVPYTSRASVTTTDNLDRFSVWAWNGDNEFMDDVIATKYGTVFTTSPLYFWPTGTVDFYALVPATEITGYETENGVQTEYAYLGGELDTEFTDEDGTKWAYKGNVAKAKIVKDAISIEAVIPGSHDEQIDLCYAVAKGYSGGSVPMNFRHALSQIVFKARNTNDEMTIKIAGASVCSVYKQGTYYLPTVSTTYNLPTDDLGTGDIASTQGYWDANEYHKARFAAGVTVTTLEGIVNENVKLTTDDGNLMLLPQTVEAWDVLADSHDDDLGAYIRILCNISEDGSQLWPNTLEEEDYAEHPDTANLQIIDGVEYGEIAIPVDIEWEQGYRYTYNIVFGEGAGYYPPDDPNYGLDGTPILYPITFDVTVDEFQDADGIDVTTEAEYDDIIPYLLEDNFKTYALENFDRNKDGRVSEEEAGRVLSITCHTVADFAGIEYFPNITSFVSYSAETVDLSANTELMWVQFSSGPNGTSAPLKSIDLSDNTNITSLQTYAFYGCGELETVILPDSVTKLGDYLFSECYSLTYVVLPEGLTTIAYADFRNCTSLESIDLPSTLVEIRDFAFAYCESLADVDIPEGVTGIGNSAFFNCSSLTGIVLPDRLETLDSQAFYGTGLVAVELPAALASLGASCFQKCTSLESIDFGKTSLTSLPTSICYGCSALTSVALPSTLTSFENNVFYECTALPEIELPETLTAIGGTYVFYRCSKLNNVTIPENVEYIGAAAFRYCNSMRTMYALPLTPPEIGDRPFYGFTINGNTCDLYVPAESLDAYTEAWGSYFTSISAIEN